MQVFFCKSYGNPLVVFSAVCTLPPSLGSVCAAKHYQMLSFNARLSFNLTLSRSLSSLLQKIRQEVGPSGMERKNI